MQREYHYMVDFSLPDVLTEEFLGLIPQQRARVNRLFREGKLINYALSLENSKMWAVFNANSELDVMDMVTEMPLSKFMRIEVSILTFYNSMTEDLPAFSMN